MFHFIAFSLLSEWYPGRELNQSNQIYLLAATSQLWQQHLQYRYDREIRSIPSHRLTATSSNGMSYGSSLTNSNWVLILNNINIQNSSIPFLNIIILFFFIISSLMHLLWLDLFQILDIHLHKSSKSIICLLTCVSLYNHL